MAHLLSQLGGICLGLVTLFPSCAQSTTTPETPHSLLVAGDEQIEQNLADKCEAFSAWANRVGAEPRADATPSEGDIIVSSAEELTSAIREAESGSIIHVDDGFYPVGTIRIDRPLSLIALRQGQAQFGPDAMLEILAPDVTISGFTFTDGGGLRTDKAIKGSIYVTGRGAIISDNVFFQGGRGSVSTDRTGISIFSHGSHDLLVENNVFLESHGVAIKAHESSRRPIIRQNDFLDAASGYGGVGEIAHIGDAWTNGVGWAPFPDRVQSEITENYVRDWYLEGELISIKSDQNHVHRNVVVDSKGAAFVIRMGHDNRISDNILVGGTREPVSISGSNNLISDNYFSAFGGMAFLYPDVRYSSPSLNLNFAYLAADKTHLENNIFRGSTAIQVERNLFGNRTVREAENVEMRDNYVLSSSADLLSQALLTDERFSDLEGTRILSEQAVSLNYCDALEEQVRAHRPWIDETDLRETIRLTRESRKTG